MFVSAVFFLDSFKLFVGRILDVKYLQLLPRWILKFFLRIRVLKSSLDLIVKIRFRYKWLRKLLQICIFIFIIISRKIKITMVKKTIECNKRYNKSRKTTLKHIHLHFICELNKPLFIATNPTKKVLFLPFAVYFSLMTKSPEWDVIVLANTVVKFVTSRIHVLAGQS